MNKKSSRGRKWFDIFFLHMSLHSLSYRLDADSPGNGLDHVLISLINDNIDRFHYNLKELAILNPPIRFELSLPLYLLPS